MSLALDLIKFLATRLEGIKEITEALNALDEALESETLVQRILSQVEPVAGNL